MAGSNYRDRSSKWKAHACDYEGCGATYHNKQSLRRHETHAHGRQKRTWPLAQESLTSDSTNYNSCEGQLLLESCGETKGGDSDFKNSENPSFNHDNATTDINGKLAVFSSQCGKNDIDDAKQRDSDENNLEIIISGPKCDKDNDERNESVSDVFDKINNAVIDGDDPGKDEHSCD